MIRQAELIKCDLIPKCVGQGGVAPPLGCLQCLPSSFFRLTEMARFSERSGKGSEVIGIFAAGESDNIFRELDCPIAIAN